MSRKVAAVVVIGLAVSLGGCVSLFPKTKPVQLYSFNAAVAAAASASKPAVSVLRGPTVFTRTAASDRILTRNGAETAYIAEARWAAPAQIMFDEALSAAFDNSQVRLAIRGEPAPTDAVLRLEVRTFEARYTNGADTAPTAIVEARATLTSLDSRGLLATRIFKGEKAATDNRTGPIVEAYDGAVGQVLEQVVAWTAETVKPKGAP
ncbi:ABC-type transport auxiliary lipoprotein family protein [soil metagenome]